MSSICIEWIPIGGGNWVHFWKRVFECLIILRSILSEGTQCLLLDLNFNSEGAIDTTHNENQALCKRVKGRLILYSDARSMKCKWSGRRSLEVFSKVTDAMSSQIQPATTLYCIPHLLIPSILLSKDPIQGGWVINNTTSPASYITD